MFSFRNFIQLSPGTSDCSCVVTPDRSLASGDMTLLNTLQLALDTVVVMLLTVLFKLLSNPWIPAIDMLR